MRRRWGMLLPSEQRIRRHVAPLTPLTDAAGRVRGERAPLQSHAIDVRSSSSSRADETAETAAAGAAGKPPSASAPSGTTLDYAAKIQLLRLCGGRSGALPQAGLEMERPA